MRSRVSLIFTTFVLGVVSLLALPARLDAQVTFAPVPATEDQLDEVLRRGGTLEGERRWGEALSHYEEALRRHPGESRLEQRLSTSKAHYDLARRYNDASFTQSLNTLSEQDALALYTEVLLKIQSHYVDQPNWQALVDRGTLALDIALADPVFVTRHLRQVPSAEIERFRTELRGMLQSRATTTRQHARDAVAAAASLARRRLGVPATAVALEYTCGATNALDDYSAYLTADQLNEVYSQIDGNFVGLGIELKSADNVLLIVKVIPSSPAERSGLKAGDSIVAVDGTSTADMNTDEAANLLQGEEGTRVTITAVTPGQQARKVVIERAHVDIPSVTDEAILDADRGVAYLKLTCFQKTTTRDLDAALWKLYRAGMQSLIMDLRGNPGGLLTSSVEVVDKFVETGTIVSTRGRNPHEDFNYSAHKAGTWHVPLVVLIDGDSASASEIFAGAIRDHRRGTIVGTRSYGKGSVQGIFPLSLARSGLRLTTAKFYSPTGQGYSKVGVKPDVLVEQSTAKPVIVAKPPVDDASGAAAPVGAGEGAATGDRQDLVLDEALRIARGQMARR